MYIRRLAVLSVISVNYLRLYTTTESYHPKYRGNINLFVSSKCSVTVFQNKFDPDADPTPISPTKIKQVPGNVSSASIKPSHLTFGTNITTMLNPFLQFSPPIKQNNHLDRLLQCYHKIHRNNPWLDLHSIQLYPLV